MKNITAVIITKNEEAMIADCLESLFFCSDVVVIDSKSEDLTVEIAERMGARVISHESKNFSEARNFGLEQVKTDWIFYVDADERVSKDLQKSLETTLSGSPFSAFYVFRKNFYFGNYEWPYVEKIVRVFRKDDLRSWKGELHETPVVEGKIGELTGYLLHYTHRNLSEMVAKTIEWSKVEADLRIKAHHPKMAWWRFPRVMFGAFFDSYIRQKGWKAGTAGLVESLYQSFSIFITYARLWELQQDHKGEKK